MTSIKIKYPYSKPFIDENDIKAVNQVLEKAYLTQGKKLIDFESKLRKMVPTLGALYTQFNISRRFNGDYERMYDSIWCSFGWSEELQMSCGRTSQ